MLVTNITSGFSPQWTDTFTVKLLILTDTSRFPSMSSPQQNQTSAQRSRQKPAVMVKANTAVRCAGVTASRLQRCRNTWGFTLVSVHFSVQPAGRASPSTCTWRSTRGPTPERSPTPALTARRASPSRAPCADTSGCTPTLGRTSAPSAKRHSNRSARSRPTSWRTQESATSVRSAAKASAGPSNSPTTSTCTQMLSRTSATSARRTWAEPDSSANTWRNMRHQTLRCHKQKLWKPRRSPRSDSLSVCKRIVPPGRFKMRVLKQQSVSLWLLVQLFPSKHQFMWS